MTAKERFIEIYNQNITREGADKLLDFLLNGSDFFTAPASTRYHGAHEGGLLAHSLNVYDCLVDILNRPRMKELYGIEYPEESIAIAALLHDVGKPFCKIRDNNSYAHPQEGARIATEILQRLKAPKKVILHTARLIENHMYDFNCQTKESKLRRYLVANADILPDLLLVKQADFSACMDDCSLAPTCARWQTLLKKMKLSI